VSGSQRFVELGGKLKRAPISRIFRNQEFGYTTILRTDPHALQYGTGKPLTAAERRREWEDKVTYAERETIEAFLRLPTTHGSSCATSSMRSRRPMARSKRARSSSASRRGSDYVRL